MFACKDGQCGPQNMAIDRTPLSKPIGIARYTHRAHGAVATRSVITGSLICKAPATATLLSITLGISPWKGFSYGIKGFLDPHS